MIVMCAHCGNEFDTAMGRYNRAKKIRSPLYCGMRCSGLGRRKGLTTDQKKALKSEYDRKYRSDNRETRRVQKAEWFKRTYDPVKAKEDRKKTMERHKEYCRRPEYREWKKAYDSAYRARKIFGDFSEAFLVLLEIEKEIHERMTRFEVYAVNDRRFAQWRKRQLSSQLQT